MPLFDEMVRLQIDQRHDPESAVAFAERGRARQLADSLAGAVVRPVDPEALRSELPPGLALVYYSSLEDRLFGWVLSRDGMHFIQRSLPAAELSQLVASFRAAIHRRAPEEVLDPISARLHDELVRPFIPFIAAQRALVFIPDEVLQSMPFAALRDRETGRYLVEDHIVGVAASGTVFAQTSAAAARMREPLRHVLAVGNPRLDKHTWRGLPDLPAAEGEAAEVASLYGRSDLLTAGAATPQAFLERMKGSQVVHYAGHAVSSDHAPEKTRLLLAADGVAGDGGALYLNQLGRDTLRHTRVVVLAACRTGAGAVSRAEGALSLARPFLAAGAPDVVASLWDIDDALSRRFFVAFHRALLAGGDPALALRNAQIAYLRSPDRALSHPASWAGFICMGGLDPHSLSKGETS
jgi:CHAT domain-containing protein